jgi:hypothetical protein
MSSISISDPLFVHLSYFLPYLSLFIASPEATRQVLGEAKAYSIGGSLPLIRTLQDQGFDVQVRAV